jgi:DNA invertase Pin-like site-specific DNA recombinase
VTPREPSELLAAHRRTATQAFDRYRRSREIALAVFRETVRGLLKEGATQAAIARAIGVSRQRLWQILNED